MGISDQNPEHQLRNWVQGGKVGLRLLMEKGAQAEEAKQEEERKRQEAEQRRIAEAKRKAEEELAALRQKQEQPKGVWTEPVTGMRLVEVPGGSFEISDQFDEGNKDEKSGWFYGDVNIQPFWLGATEVTQAQ